ncbi:MAG: hypothetical protein ABGX22_09730 [Pirellulaceae bacterium]|nr:hypothetical protein [Planctomycetaceae bacterium]
MSGEPFVLLGVNSDKDRKALKVTLAEQDITWRNWWDNGLIDGPIHTTWQVVQRPSIYIIDAKGVLRFKEIQADQIDAAIDQLLAEMTKGDK